MYLFPSNSVLATTATTFILSIIFILLSYHSGKQYMQLWGTSWLVCSAMFILDFFSIFSMVDGVAYLMARQLLSLLCAYLFLYGTCHFFQKKMSRYVHCTAAASSVMILIYPLSDLVRSVMMVPNIMICSLIIIFSGCMFITFSWTQKLPEKFVSSFLILAWSIFINHFGFTINDSPLAATGYLFGIFTVNVLMMNLIIMYFKKLRFLDSKNYLRFRLLVENSSDAMFLYDYRKKTFEYISPSMSDLIGLTTTQLYDRPDRFFDYTDIEKKDIDIVNIFSQPILRPGNGVLCLVEDGEITKWSEIHYIPIRDSTGVVTAVEGILRDITDRKKMEIELEKNESTKREFLENISHEIKTPITLIRGYSQSLLDKMVPAETTDTYLKLIDSKAEMLTNLLNDLTQLSDFSSQSMEFKFYEHNAHEFFSDTVKQGQFHITSSGHHVRTEVNIDREAAVILDSYRIQQVISNLINNSIRHTPEDGLITLICRSEASTLPAPEDALEDVPLGKIIFAVKDSGDGIDPEDLPHIFERSFSGKNRIREGSRKTGLGLYISKKIISQHSGEIKAMNNEEKGSTIWFTIPYYR